MLNHSLIYSFSLLCLHSFSLFLPPSLSLPLISDTNVIKNDLTTVEKKVRRAEGGGDGERREGEGEECKTLVNDSFYILYMYCPVHMCSYFLLLY